MSSPLRWDLDTNDIDSVVSEDLHAHRPNRWKGPKSTWQYLIREERDLWRSMEQLRDRDLAIHLYNVFALKDMAQDEARREDLKVVNSATGEEKIWVPPKVWTAWPLPASLFPKEPFLKDTNDGYDHWTYRRTENTKPSSTLEEELNATMLRLAKEKFTHRASRWKRREAKESHSRLDSLGDPSTTTSYKDEELKGEGGDEDMMHSDQELSSQTTPMQRDKEPRVALDDDESAQLLQPSTRHIISQLDQTLTILHNMRQSHWSSRPPTTNKRRRENRTYDSAPTTSGEEDVGKRGKKLGARPRGRPKLTLQGNEDYLTDPTPVKKASSSRRGRPKKTHIPLDGESEADMRIRVARESHRRLPIDWKERDFEKWYEKGERDEKREKKEPKGENEEDDGGENGDVTRKPTGTHSREEKQQQQMPKSPPSDLDNPPRSRRPPVQTLHDWSTILGAATLAGFPPDVISRTAQRCANLFSSSMTIRHLNEVPLSQNDKGIQSSTFLPQAVRFPSPSFSNTWSSSSSASLSGDDEEEGDKENAPSRRSQSRSRSRSKIGDSDDDGGNTSGGSGRRMSSITPSSPASRSHSPGFYPCPVDSCARSSEGFTRRANLKRHMKLVHPAWNGDTEEVDSEDELVGCVHRDGFLKPIMPGRGWRGQDKEVRRMRKKTPNPERRRLTRSASRSRMRGNHDSDDDDHDDNGGGEEESH